MVQLKKVVLEKRGDTHKISLDKTSNQSININLNWTSGNKQKKGFFASLFGGNDEIDLDLGCYFELIDGTASCIDGLQFANGNGGPRNVFSRQGCYTNIPFIWHTGDDRSGSVQEGENIIVNPAGTQFIRRMVIYTYIYEGAARWDETDAVVTVSVPNQAPVVVEMGKQHNKNKFCVIASLYFSENEVQVRKDVTFHTDHYDCDQSYHWGLRWQPGSK